MACLDQRIVGLVNDFQVRINGSFIDIVKCCKGKKRIRLSGVTFFGDFIGRLQKRILDNTQETQEGCNVVQEADALVILRSIGVHAINEGLNTPTPGSTDGMMFLTRGDHHDCETPTLNLMGMKLCGLNFYNDL